MTTWNSIEAKFNFLKQIVGDAQIVVEVGAKTGGHTQLYLDMFPNAHIYAVEPSPGSYYDLARLSLKRERVVPVPLAMLDTSGQIDFNVMSHAGSCSILSPDEDWDEVSIASTVEVWATTLDTFSEDRGIDHINLLAIDTNGVDLQVLKGASESLGSGRIDVICAELIFWSYFKDQCKHDEIIEFLADYGMHLVAVFPVYWEGTIRYADAIFIKEAAKDERRRSCCEQL